MPYDFMLDYHEHKNLLMIYTDPLQPRQGDQHKYTHRAPPPPFVTYFSGMHGVFGGSHVRLKLIHQSWYM